MVLLNHGLQLNYPQPVRLEQVLLDAKPQNRQQNGSSNAQALSFHEGFQLFNLDNKPRQMHCYCKFASNLLNSLKMKIIARPASFY
ncbi:capsule biosynthesis GfcC family protein [Vibrio vulnificus]|uniref:capsule biosynthesis GfcC family protein n=1 Tax=Vibrio vulnificus TaxID=672 RepID=UPI00107D5D3A|nr:capsule biosynthesis GfcC family protein [Vibrio vulnificus]QBH28397.1 YjbG polysaccharide synthesis-related protein [Vibrio vulnificus]